MENLCNRQATTPLLLGTAIASLVWYCSFLLTPDNIGNPIAYALLLIAEGIGMIQLLGVWFTVMVGAPRPPRADFEAAKNALRHHPAVAGKVAVFVPVCGEPIPVIRRTLTAARDIRLPHVTYVLDDGSSDDVRSLAKELGIGYLRRTDRTGWKAGNVNNGLKHVPSDFFVIFDSDHVPRPEFLEETLPHLLLDKELAFVQTPQHMGNDSDYVAGGLAESQEIFYRHIQTGKNRFNAAFCVGTNVIFRTKAIMEMGGMYQKSHSEDIWTSLLLHEKGWKSLYLPTVLAIGQAPETVDGFFRQQFRWASGGYEVLFKRNPILSRTLTLDQKLQYLHTTLFFLSGFSVCIFYMLPLLYVYFGWKPLLVENGAASWMAHFLPYGILLYATTIHLMGRLPRWRTFVMGLGAFPAHIFACIGALTGMRIKWHASGVVQSNIDRIKSIMFHLLFLLLTIGAIPVLILSERNTMMIFFMTAWLSWNGLLLLSLCRRAFPRDQAEPSAAYVPSPALS